MYALAAMARCHHVTADRYMRDRMSVRPSIRERLDAAARDLELAQTTPNRKTDS